MKNPFKAHLLGIIMSLLWLSVAGRYWKLYPKDELVKGKCLLECLRIYDPVCGSDGKTYSNECTFERAKCLKPDLSLQGLGSCIQLKKDRLNSNTKKVTQYKVLPLRYNQSDTLSFM